MDNIQLWEILVPTMMNSGIPVKTRFHKIWDKKVYDITGGLTILMPAKGRWVTEDGTLFAERMIPVRIASTRKPIDDIIDLTMEHYEQLAIMAYKISEEVIIKNK